MHVAKQHVSDFSLGRKIKINVQAEAKKDEMYITKQHQKSQHEPYPFEPF
jgi:hypothetical protein